MKNFYRLDLLGLKRDLPLIDMKDNLAYANFLIMGDVEMTERATTELIKILPNIDIVVTAEARGISLAYSLANKLGHKNLVIARKSLKGYMVNPISEEVKTETSKSIQKIYLEEEDFKKLKNKKVCLIDDVISTGESIDALCSLVKKAGGIVLAKAAVLAEGNAAKRRDICYLDVLPLFKKLGDDNYLPIKEN